MIFHVLVLYNGSKFVGRPPPRGQDLAIILIMAQILAPGGARPRILIHCRVRRRSKMHSIDQTLSIKNARNVYLQYGVDYISSVLDMI